MLIDGGISTAVNVPNSSRSMTTPSAASSPQTRSTACQARSESRIGTFLDYGRL